MYYILFDFYRDAKFRVHNFMNAFKPIAYAGGTHRGWEEEGGFLYPLPLDEIFFRAIRHYKLQLLHSAHSIVSLYCTQYTIS